MANLRKDDLTIPQGTTWAIRWPIEGVEDLVGYTVRSQVRRNANSDEILHEWSTALGNATVGSSFIELRVQPEVSSTWNWNNKFPPVYDVELVSPTGDVARVTQGVIKLSPEVTR